jgi:osmotically-inducible protein OsmY
MSRNRVGIVDLDLQLRVQIALDHWAHHVSAKRHDYVLAIANPYGEVTLRGHVDGQRVAEQATHIAQQVPGVHLVFNYIATN